VPEDNKPEQRVQALWKTWGQASLKPRALVSLLLSTLIVAGLGLALSSLPGLWRQLGDVRLLSVGPLIAAAVLHAVNWGADAAMWRVALAATSAPRVRMASLVRLSLAVHFANQVLPTAGLSGGVALVQGLERRGLSRESATGVAFLTALSFYASHVISLAGVLWLWPEVDHAVPRWLQLAAPIGAAALLGSGWLWLRRRARGLAPAPLAAHWMGKLGQRLGGVDWKLAASPLPLVGCTALQLLSNLIDAISLQWLLAAAGAQATVATTFAAFILGTLARSAAPMLNGLGAMDAAMVFCLRLGGVPLPQAIVGTLLYRLIRLLLPLGPGAWASRAHSTRLSG
jgi:glycosyltransferase 2 family protein